MELYRTVGVIMNNPEFDESKLDDFLGRVVGLRNKGIWSKEDILELYFNLMPEFSHKETGKYLDQRM